MSNGTSGLALLLVLFIAGSVNAAAQDSDHDGIADALDLCPDTAQLRKLPANFKYAAAVNQKRLEPGPQAYPVDTRGCEPDSDGDGIVNSQDYCPEDTPQALSKGIAANGCPKHSDFDGTPEYRDKCPNTPRGVKTDGFGCPEKNPLPDLHSR